mgnify:CR=1 FL=1
MFGIERDDDVGVALAFGFVGVAARHYHGARKHAAHVGERQIAMHHGAIGIAAAFAGVEEARRALTWDAAAEAHERLYGEIIR